MHEVVAFGEAMIRLTSPPHLRLEQTNSLDVTVGGGELNVAVSCARLGLRSAWVSRLTDNPLGRMIADRGREHGVDMSHVIWTKGDRVGLYFVEIGAAPRASRVYYDRARSAISQVRPNEIDWSLLADARLFHVGGITPALSPSAAEASAVSLAEAKRHGCKVTFDLNYRATLWSQDEARECCTKLMEHVDVLISTSDDTERVFGMTGEPADVARQLRDRFGFEAVAITMRTVRGVRAGAWTAIVLAGDALHTDKSYDLEIVDRIGSGDAFSAGFIYGYLHDDFEMGLKYGNALSVIKHSHWGDFCYFTEAELKDQMEGAGLKIHR
jgi:2-dehydro-3-deoxygluconokinase